MDRTEIKIQNTMSNEHVNIPHTATVTTRIIMHHVAAGKYILQNKTAFIYA